MAFIIAEAGTRPGAGSAPTSAPLLPTTVHHARREDQRFGEYDAVVWEDTGLYAVALEYLRVKQFRRVSTDKRFARPAVMELHDVHPAD